jgi:acetyltransferase-like isoleucine patch superfamily enzyme
MHIPKLIVISKIFIFVDTKIRRILLFLKTNVIYKLLFKKIGSRSFIINPIKLSYPYISCGQHVQIANGGRIEAITSYGNVKFEPEIIFEDNVSIEQNCHITAAGRLSIGQSTTISVGVLIQDTDHDFSILGKNALEQQLLLKETIIGKNCFIGAGSMILAGTQLGDNCIIGANSVVKGTFPKNCLIVGSPAKTIKKFDATLAKWSKVDNKV